MQGKRLADLYAISAMFWHRYLWVQPGINSPAAERCPLVLLLPDRKMKWKRSPSLPFSSKEGAGDELLAAATWSKNQSPRLFLLSQFLPSNTNLRFLVQVVAAVAVQAWEDMVNTPAVLYQKLSQDQALVLRFNASSVLAHLFCFFL